MVIFHSYVKVYQRVIGNHQEEATFSQNSDFFKLSRSSDSGGWCAWLTYQTNMAHVVQLGAGCAPLVFVKVIWESQHRIGRIGWWRWENVHRKPQPSNSSSNFMVKPMVKTHGKNMVKTHGEPTHGFPVFRFSQQNFHRSTPRIPSSADLGCQRQPRWSRAREGPWWGNERTSMWRSLWFPYMAIGSIFIVDFPHGSVSLLEATPWWLNIAAIATRKSPFFHRWIIWNQMGLTIKNGKSW